MKKKIYVAYTGGTIGMKKSSEGKGYVPVQGYFSQTVKALAEFNRPEMPEFDIIEYQPLLDSSDMTPSDWLRIASDIQKHYHDYDGFVVLHGTDTMAFTASALSFMFENLGKPVIVTGSQIPLSEIRSDGQENLLTALYLAAHYPVAEVALYFNNQLFRGNRAIKAHADGFAAFASPNFPPLIEAGIQIKLIEGQLCPSSSDALQMTALTEQPIGVVYLYPGINVKVIENLLQQPVKALILKSYGVGNAPQSEPLLQSLKQASARGIVIVNLSQCVQGCVNMGGYATGNALRQAGVISGFDMTLEACLTKLHYLLSQELNPEQVRALMQQNLRGELSPC